MNINQRELAAGVHICQCRSHKHLPSKNNHNLTFTSEESIYTPSDLIRQPYWFNLFLLHEQNHPHCKLQVWSLVKNNKRSIRQDKTINAVEECHGKEYSVWNKIGGIFGENHRFQNKLHYTFLKVNMIIPIRCFTCGKVEARRTQVDCIGCWK